MAVLVQTFQLGVRIGFMGMGQSRNEIEPEAGIHLALHWIA